MPFSDYKTALVTGASSGIGAAIVERFRREGLEVHALARSADALRELAGRTGATYVDLMPAMLARGVKYPDLYFSCDKHWNAFGNAVAADILEPYVRAALQSSPAARGN